MPSFPEAFKFTTAYLLGGLGLGPWCSFFPEVGIVPGEVMDRPFASSHERVYSCTAWRRSSSGSSFSHWCNHWGGRTELIPSLTIYHWFFSKFPTFLPFSSDKPPSPSLCLSLCHQSSVTDLSFRVFWPFPHTKDPFLGSRILQAKHISLKIWG